MDNRNLLEALLDRAFSPASSSAEKIRLAYLDPPFMSGKDRSRPFLTPATWGAAGLPARIGETRIYSDRWRSVDDYLAFLEPRLALLRDALSPDGSLYLHLDQRVSHYAKVMMDRLFGRSNFRNEIIWRYVSGGVARRHFARKHDTILFYSRSKDYVFHPQKERKPAFRDFDSPHGADDKGPFVWYIRPGSNPKVPKGVRKYLDGYVSDVWYVPVVNPQAAERIRTGVFPSQKPLALLERIILASSDEGDLVIDPFCGSGTTAEASARLGRRFLCSDLSAEAVNVSLERILRAGFGAEVHLPTAAFLEGTLTPFVRPTPEGLLLSIGDIRPVVPDHMKPAFDKARGALAPEAFTLSLLRMVSAGREDRRGRFRGTARALSPLTGSDQQRPEFGPFQEPVSELRVIDLFGRRHTARLP